VKHLQIKFHADIMIDSKVIRSKKVNLSLGQNFLLHNFLPLD